MLRRRRLRRTLALGLALTMPRGAVGAPSPATVVRELAIDSSPAIGRLACSAAVAIIEEPSSTPSERAIAAGGIAAYVESGRPVVERAWCLTNVRNMLGWWRPDDPVNASIRGIEMQLLDAPGIADRLAGAEGARGDCDPKVGRLLARLALPDEPARVRVAALSNITTPMRCDITTHGPEWLYARTIAWALHAPQPEVVAAALGTYASAEDPAGSRLPVFLDDPRPGVRAGALEALGSRGRQDDINDDMVDRGLRDPAPIVREAAIDASLSLLCPTPSELSASVSSRGAPRRVPNGTTRARRSPTSATTRDREHSAGSSSATPAGYELGMEYSLRSLRLLAATASLAGLGTLVLPGTAGAAVASASSDATLTTGTHDFTTTLSPLWVGGGSYVGVLELRVAKDGSISGFFRNNDVGGFHQITGGISGSDVWLDLGTINGGRPFNGTYRDGQIHGGIYADGQPYEFLAAPSPAISGDAGAITPTSPR